MVIQHNISYPLDPAMAGNRYSRQRGFFSQESIHCDKTFHSSVLKHRRIGCEQFRIVTVSNGKEEKVLLSQITFDAADHERTVGVADFLHNHSNRVGTVHSQGAREEIRPIVQVPYRRQNSFLSMLRNRMRG